MGMFWKKTKWCLEMSWNWARYAYFDITLKYSKTTTFKITTKCNNHIFWSSRVIFHLIQQLIPKTTPMTYFFLSPAVGNMCKTCLIDQFVINRH